MIDSVVFARRTIDEPSQSFDLHRLQDGEHLGWAYRVSMAAVIFT
jgi:hypothetical protein